MSTPSSTSPTTPTPSLSILFVCLGNICRSPLAHAVLRSLTLTHTPSQTLITHIDSAGTGAYHTGSPPDLRTLDVLARHGITDYDHGARKVTLADFEDFDYIFAMDASNLRDLLRMQRRVDSTKGHKSKAKVMLFGEFGGKRKAEQVGDPYYGEDDGFEEVYEQVMRMSKTFLQILVEKDVAGQT